MNRLAVAAVVERYMPEAQGELYPMKMGDAVETSPRALQCAAKIPTATLIDLLFLAKRNHVSPRLP